MTATAFDAELAEVGRRTDAIKAATSDLVARLDAMTGDPCPLCGLWHWGTCLEHALRVWEGSASDDRHATIRRLLSEAEALKAEARDHQDRAAALRDLLPWTTEPPDEPCLDPDGHDQQRLMDGGRRRPAEVLCGRCGAGWKIISR